MTKTELYSNVSTQVLELITTSNMSKADKEKLMNIIDINLKPKSGGGSSNPPMEIDGVMNHYCRFHQQYEPEENMVMASGKSKGYCRAAISKWNKMNSQIKKLGAEVMELMDEDQFKEAKEKSNEAKELKAALNNPESFDYEADWAAFNA